MKRFFLIFLLFPILSVAQSDGVQTVLINEDYTWDAASRERCDSFYFQLLPVCNTAYNSYIRFSMAGCFVDLYSNDSKNYQGFVTTHTTQFRYKKDKSSGMEYSSEFQYFYKTIIITPDTATMIAEALFKSGLDTIPTDTLLTDWHFLICDCNTFIFEIKNERTCTYQEYFCPWGQRDTAEHVDTIRKNIKFLLSVLNTDSLHKNLMNHVPLGYTYSSNGINIEYLLTEREQKHYKKHKPQIEYLETMKDTIDYYLEKEIEKADANLDLKSDHISFYDDFFLTFNKKGKLKKVSHHNNPKLFATFYISDMYDIYCTKKIIRKIFRKTDLRHLKLKHGFRRSCSFDYDLKIFLTSTLLL